MAVLSLVMSSAGRTQVLPQIGQMKTNDLSASVTAASYLNPIVNAESISINNGDFIFGVNSDASHLYTVGIAASTGVITLTQVV